MLKLSRPLPGEALGGQAPPHSVALAPGYRAVILDAEGAEKLERALPYQSGAALRPRVVRGDLCYAAVGTDGEVGAFAWLATGPTSLYVYELAGHAHIPEGVAFVYEVFTFPRARNLGLARGLVSGLVQAGAGHGRELSRAPRRVEAWVETGNAPSLRVFSRLGFEPYGRWRVGAVGPARVVRGDPSIPLDVPLWPDRVGSEAGGKRAANVAERGR